MTHRPFLLTAALCLLAAAPFTQQSSADTLTYTDGDVFIGFHSSTATNEYLWNIGSFSLFDGQPVGTHLSLRNVNADLTTVFGSSWPTNNFIQWGAVAEDGFDASGNQIAHLFASRAEPTLGFPATPWSRQSFNAQSSSGSYIEGMAYGDFLSEESTANNPGAVIHPSVSNRPSWAANQRDGSLGGGISFQTWNPTIEAPITPGSGSGISTTAIDFFRILPDNSATNPESVYIGTFTIDAAGNVSFDVRDFSAPPPTPTPTPTPSPSPSITPTPSPSPTVSPSPSPSPSSTPSPSVTPTPSPSATPPLNANLGNISTRVKVGKGDNVLIGGFIITGSGPKKVIIRAIGPSVSAPGTLADPTLTLYNKSGKRIASNDDWMNNSNKQEIINSTVAPKNDKEAALLLALKPGSYTAVVKGKNDTTGVGLLEVYDLQPKTTSKIANISTRGFVQTGDDVMIAGTIIVGENGAKVVIRAIGPSLPLANALLDPTLSIYNGSGVLMFTNNNWMDLQKQEIKDTGLAPTNPKESAILAVLPPGSYTAVVKGVRGSTGNALVEIFRLSN